MVVPKFWKQLVPDADSFLDADDEGYLTVFYKWADSYQYRHVVTALVPNDKIEEALHFKGFVSAAVASSGDIFWRKEPFTPWFNIELNGGDYEPFVLEWQCGANYLSAAVIDPKFCMTYQLCPRLEGEKTLWDDRSKPEYKIAQQTNSNKYDGGGYEQISEVKIRKDYVERYLSVRKASLVLIFEGRLKIPLAEQNKVSLSNDFFEENFERGQGRLIYIKGKKSESVNVVLSYAALQLTSKISTEEEYEQDIELTWPGDAKAMTSLRASSFQNDYKYAVFRDEVLADYQKDPDITVNPLSLVRYGDQWSLGFSRHGRNFIRVSMKELYSGVSAITRNRWYRYAVSPDVVKQVKDKSNIASRAKDLYEAYKLFCESLVDVASNTGLLISLEEISGIDFREVEYHGWWTHPYLKALGVYAPEVMSEEEFLRRCTDIEKFLEHLKPAALKRILNALGFDNEQLNSLQRNKLVQALLNIANKSVESG